MKTLALLSLWQCKTTVCPKGQKLIEILTTVKPVSSGHSKRRPKIGFHDLLSLNASQKYCRMLQESILQYFRPSLSYHLSLKPLFCIFLSDRLSQVLLYISSAYHDSCVPAEKRHVATETAKPQKEGEFAKCDHVTKDTIWKQSVGTERRCLKNW